MKSHCNAFVSLMENRFFDCSGEEEGKKIFKRMDEERNTNQKIKMNQEI